MNEPSDQDLLRNYAERKSDSAFATLVERYVDLVHSAAFRMSGDPHSAKDITQCVFVALAQNARQLTERVTLAGWLHNTARNLASKEIRSQIRRRSREQEAVAMNELLTVDSAANWEDIAPHLDAALGELDEPDRDAVLLRYFKNHDLRTVGATLGISDDAAQKRVSRAVERLRDFFAKRGVTVGASGLAVAISANAVQAAPVGLALTISTAAALTGTTLATTATVTATKAIAMTALQKTIVTATIVVLAGVGIYEARQTSHLREQVQALQQQQAPWAEQVAQLSQALTDATNQVAAIRNAAEKLNQNTGELLRLRGEIGRLRAAQSESATNPPEDSVETEAAVVAKRVIQIRKWLDQNPDQKIPELRVLFNSDWLQFVSQFSNWNGTEQQMNFVTSILRKHAKERIVRYIGDALGDYAATNQGQLPTSLLELRPYLEAAVTDEMLARYELLQAGNLNTLLTSEPIISEKMPSQRGQYDAIYKIGAFGYSYEQLHELGSSGSGDFGGSSKLKRFTKR